MGGFLRGAGGDLGGGFRRILFTSEYGSSGEIHNNWKIMFFYENIIKHFCLKFLFFHFR